VEDKPGYDSRFDGLYRRREHPRDHVIGEGCCGSGGWSHHNEVYAQADSERRGKIMKLLSGAPAREGYSISEVADLSKEPISTVRDELKSMRANGIVDSEPLGKAKLYRLRKK
jgi:DNA-binding transcriptional ArsR family regulator